MRAESPLGADEPSEYPPHACGTTPASVRRTYQLTVIPATTTLLTVSRPGKAVEGDRLAEAGGDSGMINPQPSALVARALDRRDRRTCLNRHALDDRQLDD